MLSFVFYGRSTKVLRFRESSALILLTLCAFTFVSRDNAVRLGYRWLECGTQYCEKLEFLLRNVEFYLVSTRLSLYLYYEKKRIKKNKAHIIKAMQVITRKENMYIVAKKSGNRKLPISVTHVSASSRLLLAELNLHRSETMASRPVVLCYSSFNPPRPAFDALFELAPAYENDFTLLDQVAVADLKEDERAKVEGIVCTGGYARTDHKLGKEIMDLLPNMKVISTPSTGINDIDVQAAIDRGVRVGRSPGHFQGDAVAEFAFGLLLASARLIVLANEVAKRTVFSSGQVSKQELIRILVCLIRTLPPFATDQSDNIILYFSVVVFSVVTKTRGKRCVTTLKTAVYNDMGDHINRSLPRRRF